MEFKNKISITVGSILFALYFIFAYFIVIPKGAPGFTILFYMPSVFSYFIVAGMIFRIMGLCETSDIFNYSCTPVATIWVNIIITLVGATFWFFVGFLFTRLFYYSLTRKKNQPSTPNAQ